MKLRISTSAGSKRGSLKAVVALEGIETTTDGEHWSDMIPSQSSSCLLHAVSKMTRGRRYAFLSFLYDEAASKIREANNKFLGEAVDAYEPS